MKSTFKLLFFMLLMATSLFVLCASADAETSTQIPQEWIDEYIALNPNSETAIRHRFPDIPDDWSKDALVSAVQNGLLNGSDGKIMPKDNLTRAQLAAIMVRAFGATEMADVSSFTDLRNDQWYYADMAKAVKMDLFRGDGSGTIRPDDPITRQEVFVVVSRAFAFSGANDALLERFTDNALLEGWARDATASLIAGKYVNGSGDYLNPRDLITRAEFAQIMKNIVGAYITESGVYSNLPAGNIVVRASGVSINNATVTGDLIIGEGVGKAITLTNVTSNHRVVVRGGTSTVLTGDYANVIVIGEGLTVNATGASIKKSMVVEGSVLLAPTIADWGNVSDGSDDKGSGVTLPQDKDGDGWIDGWY